LGGVKARGGRSRFVRSGRATVGVYGQTLGAIGRRHRYTHYDPDPETSHGQTHEPQTVRDVLIGAQRNEGDVAAQDGTTIVPP
jgi:hypothetical protein